MAIKRQPESEFAKIDEHALDWFRVFLKHLEIELIDSAGDLPAEAGSKDYALTALKAARRTLVESGLDHEQVLALFGRAAYAPIASKETRKWNSELNKRRFELIDKDIQGTISQTERLELADLTQLMRQHVDSDSNLPMQGAQRLHRHLLDLEAKSMDFDQ